MSYKVFSNGSVLNASELNEFLMNQSVIAFSNATARSSAITSPVEGMITYLEDSNSYQSWDGSSWVGLVPQSGNAIINGAFEINQRNFTSTTTSGTFGFDRWNLLAVDGTNTYSAEAFPLGTAPLAGYESANFARVVSSGQTATNSITRLRQRIEGVRSFANETITISYFAKAGSGNPKIALRLTQNFGSGGSSAVNVFAGSSTLSTSFARYSHTVAVPSISGKTIGASDTLEVSLVMSAGSDIPDVGSIGIQSNTFDIWGVQVEAGPVATPFRRNANSLQGELAACQRYYQRIGGVVHQGYLASLTGISTTGAQGGLLFPVEMRSAPAASSTGDFTIRQGSGTLSNPVTSIGFASAYPQGILLANANVASGMVAGNSVYIRSEGATLGFLEFSAEL
jgi:hypothetical protein